MDYLKNKYNNNEYKALLLGTGPSLNLYKDYFNNIPDNYIIFCIKTSIDVLPHGRCNYHLLNNMKLKKYKYKVSKPFVVFASVGKKEKEYVNSDLRIRLKGTTFSKTNNYKSFLDFDLFKKPGPGIMYDLALPFIYFLGFRNVYICGWDLFPIGSPSNLHFDGKYGHKKLRAPCRYKGNYYNESDVINLMSEPVYEECKRNNYNLYILSQNTSYISSKIPRVFCPCFHFDPYNYLVVNYQNIEHTLEESWKHKQNHSPNFVSEYNDIFFLTYICSYSDLNHFVSQNLHTMCLQDHNEIKDAIISMAKYHYNDIGKHEILSSKRTISIFDPWCYIASYFEHKHDYWDIENNTLNIMKTLYTWITVGFPNNLKISVKNHCIAKKLLKI